MLHEICIAILEWNISAYPFLVPFCKWLMMWSYFPSIRLRLLWFFSLCKSFVLVISIRIWFSDHWFLFSKNFLNLFYYFHPFTCFFPSVWAVIYVGRRTFFFPSWWLCHRASMRAAQTLSRKQGNLKKMLGFPLGQEYMSYFWAEKLNLAFLDLGLLYTRSIQPWQL